MLQVRWCKTLAIALASIMLFGLAATGAEVSVTYSRPEDIVNLDPFDHFHLSNWTVEKCIYDYLVDVERDGTVTPKLATKWEVSSDGTEWTFHLREGVKFHNGEVFDSTAVKVSLERLLTEKLRLSGLWPTLSEIKVIDPMTVTLKFSAPNSAVLSNLSLTAMLPPKAFQEKGKALFEQPIGIGPYEFVEWLPKQRVVMKKYDAYWGKKGIADKIIYLPIFEDSTRIAGVRTGEIDIADTIPADQAVALANDPTMDIIRDLAWDQIFLMFKCDKPPFNDKRVREAISLAIDRKGIVEHLVGGGLPSRGLIPKGVLGYSEEIPVPVRDIEKAKALIKESGAQGTKISIIAPQGTYPKTNEVLQAIRAQVAETGLDVTIQIMDVSAFAERRGAGNYDMFYVGGASVGGDVDWLVGTRIIGDAFKSGFNNPEIVAAWRKARETMDRNDRGKVLTEAMKVMNKEYAPMIFVYQMENIYMVRKGVDGAVFRGDKITDLRYVTK